MSLHTLEYAASLLAVAVIVVLTDRWFPVLRDLPSGERVAPGMRSYSLGRVQMALWSVVIIGSIVYVLCISAGAIEAVLHLDPSIVKLLGITGATGVFASAVDVTKDKTVESSQSAFAGTAASIRSLDAQIVSGLTAGTGSPQVAMAMSLFAQKGDKLSDIAQQRNVVMRSKRDVRSDGFLADLLIDQNGNSLHRLQLVLFTLTYAAYFVVHVATTATGNHGLDLQLPDEVLELLGVTGGIYVGFKVPGRSTSS